MAVHNAVLATVTAAESAKLVAASQSNLIEKLSEIHKLLIKIKLLDNINNEKNKLEAYEHRDREDGKHWEEGRGTTKKEIYYRRQQTNRRKNINHKGRINQTNERNGRANQDMTRKRRKRVQFDDHFASDTSSRVNRIDIGTILKEAQEHQTHHSLHQPHPLHHTHLTLNQFPCQVCLRMCLPL